jgi:hypothetical protein
MSDQTNVTPLDHEIHFTIDGQPFTTKDRRQSASALLRLVGLDPARYDLGELEPGGKTNRFADDEVVTIRPNARFVSIRCAADVA